MLLLLIRTTLLGRVNSTLRGRVVHAITLERVITLNRRLVRHRKAPME